MSKKPSLSIQSKLNTLMKFNDTSVTHSLSKKKKYLTVVTPSQREPKTIKTLKEIKRIALGMKQKSPNKEGREIVVTKKIVPADQLKSFMTENNSWKRELTIDLKPL
jgi:hypothetical protein